MRRLFTAIAVSALAVGLTVAPGAIGKAQTKQVASTVSLSATPSTVSNATPSAISASGNVQANSSCRKNRAVSFSYVSSTGTVTPVGTPVVTGPNGDFSASLPQPTDVGPTTVTLKATVAETIRTKIIKGKNNGANKGKKKGKVQKRKFLCLSGEGTTPITVNP